MRKLAIGPGAFDLVCTQEWLYYRTSEQPVWQYRRFKQQEMVRLNDGIYVL